MKAIDQDAFNLRVYGMIYNDLADLGDSNPTLERWCVHGPIMNYRHKLAVRSTKLFIDGALGSRGAALLEPYSDGNSSNYFPKRLAPNETGLLLSPIDVYKKAVKQWINCGFQG